MIKCTGGSWATVFPFEAVVEMLTLEMYILRFTPTTGFGEGASGLEIDWFCQKSQLQNPLKQPPFQLINQPDLRLDPSPKWRVSRSILGGKEKRPKRA